jgi:hypothetical protein
MKLYYSPIFIISLIFLTLFFIAGFVIKVPLWIAILLFVPIMQFIFHEYIHVFTGWLHGMKTEYIVCNFTTMCCRFETLPMTNPKRDLIYHRCTFAGALFQSAIYSFEITFLILSGFSLKNPMPFIFAAMLLFTFIIYDILPEQCDFMKAIRYARAQHLSPLNSK